MISTLRSVYLFSHVWDAADLINWCALDPEPAGDDPRHARRGSATTPSPSSATRSSRRTRSTASRPRVSSSGCPQLGNETCVKAFSVRNYPPSHALHGMAALLGDDFQATPRLPVPLPDHARRPHARLRRDPPHRDAPERPRDPERELADGALPARPRREEARLGPRAARLRLRAAAFVQLYHQVLVFAPRDEHARAEHAVRAVWRARGFELMPDTYMQVQALLASLPMSLSPALQHDIAQARRFSTKTLANAVNLAPLLGEWTGHGRARHPALRAARPGDGDRPLLEHGGELQRRGRRDLGLGQVLVHERDRALVPLHRRPRLDHRRRPLLPEALPRRRRRLHRVRRGEPLLAQPVRARRGHRRGHGDAAAGRSRRW